MRRRTTIEGSADTRSWITRWAARRAQRKVDKRRKRIVERGRIL